MLSRKQFFQEEAINLIFYQCPKQQGNKEVIFPVFPLSVSCLRFTCPSKALLTHHMNSLYARDLREKIKEQLIPKSIKRIAKVGAGSQKDKSLHHKIFFYMAFLPDFFKGGVFLNICTFEVFFCYSLKKRGLFLTLPTVLASTNDYCQIRKLQEFLREPSGNALNAILLTETLCSIHVQHRYQVDS